MNANRCEFSAAQRMPRIYVRCSRGCHCHCQVVTAASLSGSLVVLVVVLVAGAAWRSFVVLCSALQLRCGVFIAKTHEFYLARIEELRATVANLMSISASIFVLASAAAWSQMPWQAGCQSSQCCQAARKHSRTRPNYAPKITKIVYTMRQRGMRCPPQL